jgi:DNA polymerase-3 subunit epsilon
VKVADPCGCFPTGRHYPGIAHLIKVRVVGVATELDGNERWSELPVALVDFETTGRDPAGDRIVEIGVVIGRGGVVQRRHGWLVNPGRPIPKESSDVHGIKDADVADKPPFAAIVGELAEALRGAIPAAYNAAFDKAFLLAELERLGPREEGAPPAFRREVEWVDPLVLARELYAGEQSRSLGDMARLLGIELTNAHRAVDDAEAALRVLVALGRDPRVPDTYAGLVQEQRRLGRLQSEARRMWRGGGAAAKKPS